VLQWRLEPERSVVHRPSLRSVRIEPMLHQPLELEHLEAHWPSLRWPPFGLEERQQFEQQHSVLLSPRSVRLELAPR
jgi:hypothetical protein